MTHNQNTIHIELTAAADIVDRDTFATVFAIHNRYAGMNDANEPQERSMPISVLFQKNTKKLATMTLRKGERFVVTGKLDYEKKGDKEFYTIRADDLTPIPRLQREEHAPAEPSTHRSAGHRT